ncbi:MAG: SBBP repeat-containing protein [Bryobacteraceae bacterium]
MGKSVKAVLSALYWAVLSALGLVLLGSFQASAGEPGVAALDGMYGRLPLSFEANMGQADPSAGFVARGRGYNLLLTRTEAVMMLQRSGATRPLRGRNLSRRTLRALASEREQTSVKVRLVGSDPAAPLSGAQLLPGKANYLLGKDPAKWRIGIPTYARVEQPGVYPGIDLVYYGNQRELEYDFVVAPGADPNQLRLAYDGVEGMELEAGGDLVLRTKLGEIRQHSPVVYQEIDGFIRKLPAAQVITGHNEVGFRVKDYDPSRPLVIDPTVTYGTLLGGTGGELGLSIAVDSSGNAYVCGGTGSYFSFPVTSGTVQTTVVPYYEHAFVTKLNPTGTALVYSTYLGGSGDDEAEAIAVDSAGNAYVGGITWSTDFPTTPGSFQSTSADTCCQDNFVTKLNPTGSALVYSTFLAGTDDEDLNGLAIDSAGNAYVTGFTSSTDFPVTTGAYQTTLSGTSDAYVTKLNASGSSAVYSTLLGGTGDEEGVRLTVDSSGYLYVTGVTTSTSFPTTTGAYRSSSTGGADAFVVKLNPAGSAPSYSALLAGNDDEVPFGLAVDAQGSAYVAGLTYSTDYPVTGGVYQSANRGNGEVFVSKLNPAGSALSYSTFIGGTSTDIPYGMALDSRGYVSVTGNTSSTDFPTTSGALSTSLSGTSDGFLCQLNDTGSSLAYSSYLGGSGDDEGNAVVLDTSGNAYILGDTSSTNFPFVSGGYQNALRGASDAFILKIGGLLPAARTITIVSGNNQTGAVNTNLASALVVEVDEGSTPVAGVTVTFFPTNATVTSSSVLTDAAGRAQTTVTLGSTVGTATVSASATGVTTPVVFTASVTATPSPGGSIVVTSAASYAVPPVAPGMIAVVWWSSGTDFTTVTLHAPSLPLPTSMGNVSVKIQDSGGTSRDMGLFDVSPRQLNVLIPDGTQGGNATITVTGFDGGVHTGTVVIESVAPGLFSANSQGTGLAVGQAKRYNASGSEVSSADLCRWDSTQNKFVSIPIDMGAATETTFLVVYGTGIRGRTSLVNVSAPVGGQTTVVAYAGAQGYFVGLDQLNIQLPRSLRGQGDVSIVLTVDGKTANALTVTMAAVTPVPAITSISPTSGQVGQTINNFTITGTNLTGGQVAWDNSTGLTLSSLNVGATSVTGTLAIASNATPGSRSVWVVTSGGESNHLSFSIQTPPTPTITSINPTSADPGQTIGTFTVNGSNLSRVTAIEFVPADGITVTNLNATSTTVTAQVAIASNAASGSRTVDVVSPEGKSGTVTFTINAVVDPSFVISNLRAGPASHGSSADTIPVTVDFVDPQGAVASGQTVRLNFNIANGSITGWTQSTAIISTPGTLSMTISIYGIRFNSGIDVPITVSLEAPVGVRRSNSLAGTFHSP